MVGLRLFAVGLRLDLPFVAMSLGEQAASYSLLDQFRFVSVGFLVGFLVGFQLVWVGVCWFLLVSVGFVWFRLVSVVFGWVWLVSVGFGWFRLVLVLFGWVWLVSVGFGWVWLVSVGFNWFRLVLGWIRFGSVGICWFRLGLGWVWVVVRFWFGCGLAPAEDVPSHDWLVLVGFGSCGRLVGWCWLVRRLVLLGVGWFWLFAWLVGCGLAPAEAVPSHARLASVGFGWLGRLVG